MARASVLIAAAGHVKAACPASTVRAFALLRTINVGDVAQVPVPCAGRIAVEGGSCAHRSP